jgi:glycosyltransferase involved in cell wall biosynthesis
MGLAMTKPFLSIVTPTFNEEGTILDCIRKVSEVMSGLEKQVSYEHVIIDNASTDRTLDLALDAARSNPQIIVACNDRNIGGTRNIYRGLTLTKGEWVVPMLPADLQDPAETIPEFLALISPSCSVIFGVRKNRQESLVMRTFRTLYYKMIRRFSSTDLPLHSGEFCLISRDAVDSILDVQDENPYVRGMIAQVAQNPKFVEYTWGKRMAGESKTSPFVLAEVAVTGLVSTSQIPARVALLSGIGISIGALIWALIQICIVVFGGTTAGAGIPTIVVAVFFFGGLQLFFTGLIGEYVLSIHRQVKKSPSVRTRKLTD